MNKFFIPTLAAVGTIAGSGVAALTPNSPISSNNANSIFIYKAGDKSELIVGDGFKDNLQEIPQRKGENLVRLGSNTWQYNKNSSGNSIKNSFQLVGGKKVEEEKEGWKEMIQSGEQSETNKFSGTATFYLSKIKCNDLEDRYTSTALSKEEFMKREDKRKGEEKEKNKFSWFNKDGNFVMWNCKQDGAIK